MYKDIKKTIEAYNKFAELFYARTFNKISQYHLTEFLSKLKGKKILDAGAGTGRDMIYFKEEGYNVTGIDLADEMIKVAKKKAKVTIKKMDMKKLEFKDESFNGVWCCATLLHVPKENYFPAN